jgi:hypothetical protein
VAPAFAEGPATPASLKQTARARGADGEVMEALDRLSRPSYRDLREIWSELHDVPVGS